MRSIRRGDSGRAVRDVQRRLVRLGYEVPANERGGTFGPGTETAVRAFQQKRGVAVDGLVGPDTWRELVEASWTLGDRLLYLRAPLFTGDDVRALQDRLSTLGFDCGRVDGIFGVSTDRALRDFQRNYGIPADGVVGHDTVRALAGLPVVSGDTSIATLREREAMRALGRGLAGLRIVLDPGHGGDDPGNVGPAGTREDELCFDVAVRLEAALAAAGAQVYLTRRIDAGLGDSERATLANALDAEIFLALHLGAADGRRGAAAYYFGHERFRSESGMRLAEVLLDSLRSIGVPIIGAEAKTFAVLRETRMPAVVLEPARVGDPDDERELMDPEFIARLVAAVTEALRRFTTAPAIA